MEESWGPVNHQREQSYQNSQRQHANSWEWKDGGWKWENNSAKADEDARKLGFGEYAEWTCAEVIANNRGYAQDLRGKTEIQ